ncbi:branched-chain-amino-acid aminotransferas-like protein [Periconia macrospinosa]|uniref:Branched-chain-amino-acid aminotransferase n=1 Tax=Periconia macrospinosa TaxID=97972 RepID=A0A2V1DRL0_9PLEO|nr:branched-chain-amino-acid aminotransferas-like protein [Periconia macrospinosa]
MAPMAVTPPTEVEKTSDLTLNGIQAALKKAAPSQNPPTTLTPSLTQPTGTTKPSSSPPLPELDASLLQCTYADPSQLKPVLALDDPERQTQRVSTDHMIQAAWSTTKGWSAPTLTPYGPLSLMPSASCLHYATECFEGMKLYRGFDGKLRLFRPTLNCNRMLMSSTRIALPGFPPAELLKLILKLCATDGNRWLPPHQPGQFLYIRPTMIATDAAIGVQRPSEALLFIILTVLPPMDSVPGGVKLLASEDDMCRAWPGGFGYAKVGANYGPSLVAQGEARARGFDQILWLFGPEGVVTEAGASNFFVVWKEKETGKLQLVTNSLDRQIILDGITRRSVLDLARERLASTSSSSFNLEPLEIQERPFTMSEIALAAEENRLVEAFASGTAWFVAPVSKIQWKGKDIEVPMGEDGVMGGYTKAFKGWLRGIMYGEESERGNEWGVVVGDE